MLKDGGGSSKEAMLIGGWKGYKEKGDDRCSNNDYKHPRGRGKLTAEEVQAMYPLLKTGKTEKKLLLIPTSEGHITFLIGCVNHGLKLPLERDLVKLLLHFNCSLIHLPPLAMLIYERAKECEAFFRIPFCYSELIRLFHLVPVHGGKFSSISKCGNGSMSFTMSRGVTRCGEHIGTLLLVTMILLKILTMFRCTIREIPGNAEVSKNLAFYYEKIPQAWRWLNHPFSSLTRMYKKSYDFAADPYPVEPIFPLLAEFQYPSDDDELPPLDTDDDDDVPLLGYDCVDEENMAAADDADIEELNASAAFKRPNAVQGSSPSYLLKRGRDIPDESPSSSEAMVTLNDDEDSEDPEKLRALIAKYKAENITFPSLDKRPM